MKKQGLFRWVNLLLHECGILGEGGLVFWGCGRSIGSAIETFLPMVNAFFCVRVSDDCG